MYRIGLSPLALCLWFTLVAPLTAAERNTMTFNNLLPYWSSNTSDRLELPDYDRDTQLTVLDFIAHRSRASLGPGLLGRYTSFLNGDSDTTPTLPPFSIADDAADIVDVAAVLNHTPYQPDQPTFLNSGLHHHFNAAFEGLLYVPETAQYSLILAEGDAARLFIDDQVQIHYDGGTRFGEATLALRKGFVPIRVDYLNRSPSDAGFVLAWRSTGQVIGPNNQVIAAPYLWHHHTDTAKAESRLHVAFEPGQAGRVDGTKLSLKARLYGPETQFRFWLADEEVRVSDGTILHNLNLAPGLNHIAWRAQAGNRRAQGVLTLYADQGRAGQDGLAAMFYPAGEVDPETINAEALPSRTTVLDGVNLAAAPNGYPNLDDGPVNGEQTLWLRGRLLVERSGRYTFTMNAPSAAWFYLNGAPLLATGENRTQHTLVLAAGYHDLSVVVAAHRDAPAVTLQWQPPGRPAAEDIPARLLRHLDAQWIAAADFAANSGHDARIGGGLVAEYLFEADAPFADSGAYALDLTPLPRWQARAEGSLAVATPGRLSDRRLGTHFLKAATATRAFTIEWDWFYRNAADDQQQFYRVNFHKTDDPVFYAYTYRDRFAFYFMGQRFNFPVDLVEDQRYHAVVTWDGATLHTYLNGEHLTATRFNAAEFDQRLATESDFILGDHRGRPFRGTLNTLALYDRALDETEVFTNFEANRRLRPISARPATAETFAVIPPGTDEETLAQAVHVLNRVAMGVTPESLHHILTVGVETWLEQQLQPETIAQSAVADSLAARYQPEQSAAHLEAWFAARLVHSERRLEEVMTWFWENHFNTDLTKTVDHREEYAENQRFRQLALGNFGDLLQASALNYPMITYLDGNTNVAGAPNENYAREILELHSFGEDNGYTYADIVAAARIFTGWTQRGRAYDFVPGRHDYGVKELLGLRFDQRQGETEGLLLIDHIARAPETARFISTKLCQVFVADVPPQDVVDAATATFIAAEGDMRQVLRTILFHDRFLNDPNYRNNKLKTPLEFVVSMVRAGAGDDLFTYRDTLQQMGMPLFHYGLPTGYPETAVHWLTTNAVYQRWQLANQFSRGHRLADQPALDLEGYARRYGLVDADSALDFLEALFGSGPDQRAKLTPLLRDQQNRDFDLSDPEQEARFLAGLGQAINYHLRTPRFQHQ